MATMMDKVGKHGRTLGSLTLGEVEVWWDHGLVTDDQLDHYLAEWNATPGRFNVARRMCNYIQLAAKE